VLVELALAEKARDEWYDEVIKEKKRADAAEAEAKKAKEEVAEAQKRAEAAEARAEAAEKKAVEAEAKVVAGMAKKTEIAEADTTAKVKEERIPTYEEMYGGGKKQ